MVWCCTSARRGSLSLSLSLECIRSMSPARPPGLILYKNHGKEPECFQLWTANALKRVHSKHSDGYSSSSSKQKNKRVSGRFFFVWPNRKYFSIFFSRSKIHREKKTKKIVSYWKNVISWLWNFLCCCSYRLMCVLCELPCRFSSVRVS